ncbi:hypothetical protein J3R03_008329 [Actinoplanes couchii]|nr:hypothetical protein [Actinoplanes couchii]
MRTDSFVDLQELFAREAARQLSRPVGVLRVSLFLLSEQRVVPISRG